ncbi:canalicular multispecific organic anion transporter [Achlya hypogyna]|uniref:Canalicular multispecific organic anion transporter n=1 Tax=Achlya hypogyna TaxID=1202772 RepID=A0A1V9YM99_ACHHY|nr:canalicular multispecific organic anion transporter [Achlya hypogyna]
MATTSYAAVKSPKADDHPEPQWSDAAHPLETANWFTNGTMGWITPLIVRGAKKVLTEEDVWPLPFVDTSAQLHSRFLEEWTKEKTRPVPKFHRALWYAFRSRVAFSFFLFFLYAGLQLLQPLLIKSMLEFLSAEDTRVEVRGNATVEVPVEIRTSLHISSGYALAVWLTVLSFVSVTIIDYAQYATSHLGINAKSIMIDMVCYKTLRLSGFAKQEMTTGEIVTMASVDAERLFTGFMLGYWAIVSPIMLGAVFIMVGFELGYEVGLVGAASIYIFLYVGYVSGMKVGDVRRDLLKVQAERVKLTNEVLQGIRVVKLYAWEASLQAQLAEIRLRELALLKSYQMRRTFNTVLMYIGPVISLALCLMVYVGLGHRLTIPVSFTALAYMNAARTPCTIFSTSVMTVAEAVASCQRVSVFLCADEVEVLGIEASDAAVVNIAHGDFSWAAPDAPTPTADAGTSVDLAPAPALTLKNVNLQLEPGTLTIVVGPVGSGKSSLMSAILGEIHQVGGTRHVSGNISYVNQEAWIQHATLKNNILFDSAYDDDYYNAVLAACQLKPDLAMLPEGDATEIGERGINLSGGQKARVSLARGVYHRQADIYLLDDPLSALDVHVATAVFHECIKGLLAGKTTVLVLNSHYHFLPLADRVVVLEDGAIVGDGAYESLKEAHPHLMNFTEHSSAEPSDDEADETPEDEKATKKEAPKGSLEKVAPGAGSLMSKEDRGKGSVTLATYKMYFGASGFNGYVVGISILVFFTVAQTALALTDWFMSYWAKTNWMNDSVSYGWVYVAIALVSVVLTYGRSIYVLFIAVLCSKSLHAMLFEKVVSAPVPTFFDITPMGRILNRFSSDLDQVDSQLPYMGLLFLQFLFQVLAVLAVCMVTTPWILVVYAPLFFLFYKVQQFYNQSAGELKRMDGIARSPVVTMVQETVSGLSTIRAFNMADKFLVKQRAAVDHYVSFSFAYMTAGRWFQMRLDWLSSAIIAGVAFIAVASKASIGLVAAGLSLTYATQISTMLSRVATFMTMIENIMTSVERLGHFQSLENEDDATTEPLAVPAAWPAEGVIAFNNYSMRYREHLDLVLNDVSFVVPAGAKVGICGRTGSGKSSLMAALFRMVPSATGAITVDGVDIARVSVTTLRSRLTIIPQDPVLFSGSLRFNLDPAGTAGDDELWAVLKQVHLADGITSLDDEVAERGSNFSVGQRQLLCIARALLRKSKVVVLDEATANIDLESDRRIQATIKECFVGITMLIIAHRLDTIIDSDRILVLDAGRLVEYDAPKKLLQIPDGAFAKLAEQARLVL